MLLRTRAWFSAGSRRPRDAQKGAAAVEFALIITLFMALVMGAIDWGWFFFVHQRVVNAAREGARAGTLLPPPPTSSAEQASAEADDAAEDYLERSLLERKGVSSEVLGDGDAVKVTISYDFKPLTGFWADVLPTQAKATATMRWR